MPKIEEEHGAEVARLRLENETLSKAVEHYRELAEEGTQPLIKRMKLEDGTFDMEVTGPMVEAMAIALVGQFKEGGAKNYMEMNLFDRDEIGQRYVVTVQKAGAQSPHDKAAEAAADAAKLREALIRALEWDKRRGYPIPYAVRDPMLAALSQERPA